MRLRVARHTDRLQEVVAFYRDLVGLPELGRFTDHDGYDGVFLDVDGTGAHLEFTSRGSSAAPVADEETLLVLYLDSEGSAPRWRSGSAPSGASSRPTRIGGRTGSRSRTPTGFS